MELRLGIVILTILLLCKETVQQDRQVTRAFPLCVSEWSFEEYEPNLKAGKNFKKFLSPAFTNGSQDDIKNIGQTLNGGSEFGLIESINYYRILADCKVAGNKENCRAMRQWAHIHIKTKKPVVGLIVQANTEPFFLPYGLFDLEFGCLDCNDGINLGDAKEGDALTLGGKAAVIPCDRRSHLHIRHPNVYAFAVDDKTDARKSFHINYSWMDVTCRHVSAIQFMIFAMEDWSGNSQTFDQFFSHKINQTETDSIDGMPYPYHVIWHDTMRCHIPNDELPNYDGTIPIDIVRKKKRLPFRASFRGNEVPTKIILDPDYDVCIRVHTNKNTNSPKHAMDKVTHSATYVSRRMCGNINQTKCDYNNPINNPNYGIVNGTNFTPPDPGLCDCTDDDNYYTNETVRRLSQRDYILQRVHGAAAVLGLVAINVINIHISRYFKEAGGCCMLVGWWLWTHLALSYISLGAVWVSIALVTSSERFKFTGSADPIYTDKLFWARQCLLLLHKYLGIFGMFWYHVDFLFGIFRPLSSTLRFGCICVHACTGYFVVVIAMAVVFFSNACWELVYYVGLMIGFSLIPWIIGLVLQILMDSKKKLNPGRKYFPVIEAVQVQPQLPMKVVRYAVLGVLVLLTVIYFGALVFKGGKYKGLIVSDPCNNCEYKHDEVIVTQRGPKQPGDYTEVAEMYLKYGCKAKLKEFDARRKKFESILKICKYDKETSKQDKFDKNVKRDYPEQGNYLD